MQEHASRIAIAWVLQLYIVCIKNKPYIKIGQDVFTQLLHINCKAILNQIYRFDFYSHLKYVSTVYTKLINHITELRYVLFSNTSKKIRITIVRNHRQIHFPLRNYPPYGNISILFMRLYLFMDAFSCFIIRVKSFTWKNNYNGWRS